MFQYARVSSDTNPDILYQLLTEQWKLSPPNLLISVTGGAKNFYLKSRLKDMFRRGLVKVAQTTGEPGSGGGNECVCVRVYIRCQHVPMISQTKCVFYSCHQLMLPKVQCCKTH